MAGELKQPAPVSPNHINGGTCGVADLGVGPKRQRRPSVRLGDIGDKPGNYARPNRNKPSSSPKTRPLTNLVNDGANYSDLSSGPETTIATLTKNNKRLRTNLRINTEERDRTTESALHNNELDQQHHEHEEEVEEEEEEEEEEEYRDQEHSPVNSEDGWHGPHRRSRSSIRVSELDEGVRKWLVELGLGRYAPVFEIHEVDEEVLPHLTLEDLKDMGINAVGSRRKLYTGILNLRKPAPS